MSLQAPWLVPSSPSRPEVYFNVPNFPNYVFWNSFFIFFVNLWSPHVSIPYVCTVNPVFLRFIFDFFLSCYYTLYLYNTNFVLYIIQEIFKMYNPKSAENSCRGAEMSVRSFKKGQKIFIFSYEKNRKTFSKNFRTFCKKWKF